MIFNSSFFLAGGRPTFEIPVGGVIGWNSNTPPSGWSMYTGGNNRPWRVAGSIAVPETNGGAANIVYSGSTGFAGEHSGTSDSLLAVGDPSTSSPGSGLLRFQFHNRSTGAHTHTISASPAFTPPQLRTPHIVKTSSAGEVPAGGSIYSLSKMNKPGWTLDTTNIGRLLANTTAGSASTAGTGHTGTTITTSSAGAHIHSTNALADGLDTPSFGPNAYIHNAAGAHTHNVTLSTEVKLAVVNVARYTLSADGRVSPGAIIGYVGDVGDLPPGWQVADGTNGTLDLRDRFIKIASEEDAGKLEGDGTADYTVVDVTSSGSHSHQGSNVGNKAGYYTSHSESEGNHTHTVASLTITPNPNYYGLVFIQCVG